MKKIFYVFFYIFLLISFFNSCSSTPKINKAITKKNIAIDSSNTNTGYLAITTPYTLNSLLLPVIQLNNFMLSMDYFNQFLNDNDYIFPDYLFTILAMEKGNYQSGQGSVLKSVTDITDFQYEKALVSETNDGNKWWHYHMTAQGNDLLIEVLANSYGIPLKIRFADSLTGMNYEMIPDLALDFSRAETEAPAEQLAASIAEKVTKDVEEGLSRNFINPEIIGEEPVTTSSGEYMAVHVKDYKSESESTNYWLSPDVPGGIVKISVIDTTGNETFITELSEIKTLSSPVISYDSISTYSNTNSSGFNNNSSEPGYSEGTKISPVLINADENYYGSVSDEGTSFYKFFNNKRADLFIEVSGFEGSAELVYFGNDSNFENWTTGSEGSSLNVEDYMVAADNTVYFTVHDIADEYSIGEHYSIYVNQNPILDPIGIMIKGDIYDKAVELNSGKSYILDVGNEGLDYYKTTIKNGSKLQIVMLKEPESGSLIWFDTGDGSYSSMFTEETKTGREITIDGLEPGTICYYYFASDTALLDPLQKLELQITESP